MLGNDNAHGNTPAPAPAYLLSISPKLLFQREKSAFPLGARAHRRVRPGGGSVAESEGFKSPIRLPVCRISSAVLSTAGPPLRRGRAVGFCSQQRKKMFEAAGACCPHRFIHV